MRGGFTFENNLLVAGTDLDEEALAVCENLVFGVEDARLGPMLAAFVMIDAAFEADGRAGGNGTLVVNFHVARHAHDVMRAHRLAHGFVEQGGNDSPVHKPARSFEGVRDRCHADDRAVLGEHELQVQPNAVRGSAAKATVLRGVWARERACRVLSFLSTLNVSAKNLAVEFKIHIPAGEDETDALA